jgi:hypothetical protein
MFNCVYSQVGFATLCCLKLLVIVPIRSRISTSLNRGTGSLNTDLRQELQSMKYWVLFFTVPLRSEISWKAEMAAAVLLSCTRHQAGML